MSNILNLLLYNLLLGIRVDINPVDILVVTVDVNQRIMPLNEELFPPLWVVIVDIGQKWELRTNECAIDR